MWHSTEIYIYIHTHVHARTHKSYLSTPWTHTEAVEVHLFWPLALHGGKWSNSHPGRRIARTEPRYPLNVRLRQPQSWSGRFGCKKNNIPIPRLKPRTVPSVESSLIHAHIYIYNKYTHTHTHIYICTIYMCVLYVYIIDEASWTYFRTIPVRYSWRKYFLVTSWWMH
jgi:hypothetical protein